MEALERLAPPPAAPIHAQVDWATIGLDLPADYRRYAERYGAGDFNDLWLVLPPHSLITTNAAEFDDDREMREEWPDEYPYPLYPEPGGLLMWGASSNGDRLCWLTEGRPDDWPVVMWDVRNSYYWLHRTGAIAFLTTLVADNHGGPTWFEQPRDLLHVYARLTEGRPRPYEERLRILKDALAPTIDRGSRTDGGTGRQESFVATAAQWRVTYDNVSGHLIQVAFPPEDNERARAEITRVADLMGCVIGSAHHLDGSPAWGSVR